MFVLDSADHNTLEEAKLELLQIFKHSDTNHLPIIILANKQDMPNAYDLNYLNYYLLNGLESELNVHSLNSSANNQIKIVSACAITGDGLDESLDALYEMILKKQKTTKPKKSK